MMPSGQRLNMEMDLGQLAKCDGRVARRNTISIARLPNTEIAKTPSLWLHMRSVWVGKVMGKLHYRCLGCTQTYDWGAEYGWM